MASGDKSAQTEMVEKSTIKRRPWVVPSVRILSAGSAENGLTQNNRDGQFTRS